MKKVFEFLHKLKVYLFPNQLTEDPNDLSARVSSERTLDVKNICRQAVTRGGASTSAETMEHNVNLFHKEMAYQLANGMAVNTGYYTAVAKVTGVFNKVNESFDPEKHQVSFQFNQGSILRKEIPYIEVEVMGLADTALFIDQVTDVKTGSVNDLLTPNRNLRIGGTKLKVVGEKPEVGVYFVNQGTQVRTKVDESDFVTNNPSELIIVTPALPKGEYLLEVTTQFSGNTKIFLREARTAVLDKVLTVE